MFILVCKPGDYISEDTFSQTSAQNHLVCWVPSPPSKAVAALHELQTNRSYRAQRSAACGRPPSLRPHTFDTDTDFFPWHRGIRDQAGVVSPRRRHLDSCLLVHTHPAQRRRQARRLLAAKQAHLAAHSEFPAPFDGVSSRQLTQQRSMTSATSRNHCPTFGKLIAPGAP